MTNNILEPLRDEMKGSKVKNTRQWAGIVAVAGATLALGLLFAGVTLSSPAQPLAIGISPDVMETLPGQMTTFGVAITNTGVITLNWVLAAIPWEIGNCSVFAVSLAPGEAVSGTCQGTYIFDVAFDVTAQGMPDGGTSWVSASAGAEIRVDHLRVMQSPELQSVPAGQAAPLTITVANVSSSYVIADVGVSAPLMPDCERAVGALPDLGPGAKVTFTCQTGPLFTDLETEAVATGQVSGITLENRNRAVVQLLSPLDVVVAPERQRVFLNETAGLTVTLRNVGDSTLTNVVVVDSAVPDCARSSGELADLAPAGMLSYTCQTQPLTETLQHVIKGIAGHDGTSVSAIHWSAVDVITEVLSLSVVPPLQEITPGMTATFTVTLTNQEAYSLTSIIVDAANAPDCSRAEGELSVLAPLASYSYTCHLVNVNDPFVNRVSAVAADPAMPLDQDPAVTTASGAVVVQRKIFIPVILSGF